MSETPFVTTDWLAARLDEPDFVVVDGSWYMPALKRDAAAEYAQAHIPGAVLFDIDAIADHGISLPHMLPSAARFARRSARWASADGMTGSSCTTCAGSVSGAAGVVDVSRVRRTTRSPCSTADCGVAGRGSAGRGRRGEGAGPELHRAAAARPWCGTSRRCARVLAYGAAQVVDARSRGPLRRRPCRSPAPAALAATCPAASTCRSPKSLDRPDGTLKTPDEIDEAVTAAGVDLDPARR